MTAAHPELDRLLEVLGRFRGEHGCAWYEAQSHRSLVPYLIEESAELVEALESGDPEHIREELGDVLFQVLFHADLAATTGAFDLEAVAAGLADKLVRRNPHVFGDRPTRDVDEIIRLWQEAKAVEKRDRTSVLDGIPEGLPALAKAQKLLGKAAGLGIEQAADGRELPDAAGSAAEAQLGERLLELVREARAQGLDPERALREANRELAGRIRAAEAAGC